jgi:tetratricopeptide (TPR) repeat protein
MKNYLLYFLCIFFFNYTFSQKTKQPSKISKKNEIEAYYAAGLLFIKNKNFEQAFTSLTLGFNESKKMNDTSLIAYGYFYKARYYQNKGTYLESVALLKKALTLFDELNDTSQISRCYYKLGFNYFKNLQYDVALEHYFKSLELDEKRNYNPGIALTLERIGKLYLNTGDFYKARSSFESALCIFKELKDDPRILMNELCFAVTYQKEAMKYQREELFYKAIEMYEVALVTSLKTNSSLTAALLQNIGSCYRFLKQYEISLEYLFKALPLFVSQGLNKDVAHTYNDISETFIDMKNLSKAREYVLKAIDYAKGYDLHQERYAYYVLSEVDKKSLNYKSALSNFKKYQKLEDSIFSIEKKYRVNHSV